MSIPASDDRGGQHLELPVDVLLRRARALPPREAMVIDDLSEQEGQGFLAALRT